MEHQKHKLVLDEEEEEEVPSLQSRQSQLHSSNNSNSNSNNSTASDTTTLLVNISSTNGNGNGNGKGNENGSLIRSSSSSSSSSSSNSSINDDSETPKIGVSSPCGSPHKPSVDEQRAHNLNSVYFDQHHGPNSIDGVSDVNCSGVTCSVFETSPGDVEVLVKNSEIQKSLIKDVNLQLRENSDNEGLSGSSLTPLKDTFEERNFKSKSSGSETRVAGELDLIEEIDQEVTELDIEKVLEKQNTHDLYCPNCNSCITRKVILRRRTRKIRKACRKPKHAKADAILPSELDANFIYSDANSADSADGPGHDTANICSNDCPTPAVDDNNCDGHICSANLTLLLNYTGNGFKLFRVSSTENENVQDSQKSTANTNWFFSIFGTHKRKTTTEQGNAAVDPAQVDGTNQDTTPSFSNNVTSSNGSDRSVMPHADRTMVNTREHPDGSDSKPHQSGTESLNPSLMEPLLLNNKSPGVDIRSNFEDKAINALENKNIGMHKTWGS
ncbi:unnamed protein product [Dovyalis caffra]|uniref:Uncharacterized protein n=1 Tax=Dovyalis caffra TaxID=77055 RepID=A0AAV1QWE6_9ROSI|nr:unnamed protein product [Dovyalis caffra]